MKVFISWSGQRSKALAIALKEWLPLILQYAKPWVSDKDIAAGERWAQSIAGELEAANFGILCVTPENINSEWILFEAGALSKSMLDAKVIPLLFGLDLRDLSGPLSQFQALKVDQDGMLNVIKAINNAAEHKAADATVEQLIPALWSQFQQKIDAIPLPSKSGNKVRPQAEVLEELVTQVRGLGARMREVDSEIIERDGRAQLNKNREPDFRMIEELIHTVPISSEFNVSLLMIAGLIRDRIPWLAEILCEAHRDFKSSSPKKAREIGEQLMRVIEYTMRGPFGERALSKTKAGQILMLELPILIERVVSINCELRNFS